MSVAFSGAAHADPEDVPLVIAGGQLPAWQGVVTDSIFAFVHDASGEAWTRIPLQIDERRSVQVNGCPPGGGVQNTHLGYVYSGSEGNGLDADDELVFMVGDLLGDWARPDEAPPGTDATRYELAIQDSSGDTIGYAYLFTALFPPAPTPPADYVRLTFQSLGPILEDTSVETARYRLHYGARWRIDGLSVLPPYGDGRDLIDRVKCRVGTNGDATTGETEETWDSMSCHLGHKDGPIRGIREVQGAASGTTYTDIHYASRFVRRLNLRVHPLANLIFFFDYHANVAGPSLVYYNQHNPLGVAIDGTADPSMNMALPDWELVTHPQAGGLLFTRVEAPTFPSNTPVMFWWDDATFLDVTGDNEPGRYGCHGARYPIVWDTEAPGNEGIVDFTFVPIQAGTANDGAELYDELLNPPTVTLLAQTSRCGDGFCDPGECVWCEADCEPCPDAGVPDAGGWDAAEDAQPFEHKEGDVDAGSSLDEGVAPDEGGDFDAGSPPDLGVPDEGGDVDAGPPHDEGSVPPDVGEDAEPWPHDASAEGPGDAGADEADAAPPLDAGDDGATPAEDASRADGGVPSQRDAGGGSTVADLDGDSRGCACRTGSGAGTDGPAPPLILLAALGFARRTRRPRRRRR